MIQVSPLAARWLATDPPRPLPDILTAEEACVYLRLDGADPKAALDRFRDQGRIRAVRIGKHCRYRVADLDEFVKSQEC